MSTVLHSSGSQGNEGPAQEKCCMRNKIMHHHVSLGVELMSSQHAKKHIAFYIPNSGLHFFFFYQIYIPSDLFFLVIRNCKVYFLCALIFP